MDEKIQTGVRINKEFDPSDDSVKRSDFDETRYFGDLSVKNTFARGFIVFWIFRTRS